MKSFKNTNILLIITLYILIGFSNLNNFPFYINVISPVFWTCLLLYMIYDIRKNYISFYSNRRYILYMIIISCINIISLFAIGFIFGFVKSPYNHEAVSILKNITTQILPIISMEIARFVVIARNNHNKFATALITVLLIFSEINYGALVSLFSNKEMFFEYICSTIVPLIAFNLLYTYLSIKSSFILPIIYRLFGQLLLILAPIFPNVNWFASGSINMLLALLVYILFKYIVVKEKKDIKRTKLNLSEKISYIIALIICTLLVCFILGFFEYEPITIISSSMYPIFSRGDVVIYKKISENSLRALPVGTIILYTIEGQNIAHRIVKIINENGTVLYQTKGDFNNIADENLVDISQIKGIYVFNIKYIGFPSVWLHEYFNS